MECKMQTRQSTGAIRDRRVWNFNSRKRQASEEEKTEPVKIVNTHHAKSTLKEKSNDVRLISKQRTAKKENGLEQNKALAGTGMKNGQNNAKEEGKALKRRETLQLQERSDKTKQLNRGKSDSLLQNTKVKETMSPRFSIQEEAGSIMQNRKPVNILIPEGGEEGLLEEVKNILDKSDNKSTLYSINARHVNIAQAEVLEVDGKRLLRIPTTEEDCLCLVVVNCKRKTNCEVSEKGDVNGEDIKEGIAHVNELEDNGESGFDLIETSSTNEKITQTLSDSEQEDVIQDTQCIKKKEATLVVLNKNKRSRKVKNGRLKCGGTVVKRDIADAERPHSAKIKSERQSCESLNEIKEDGTFKSATEEDLTELECSTEVICKKETENASISLDDVASLCDSSIKHEVFEDPDTVKSDIFRRRSIKPRDRTVRNHSCGQCAKKFYAKRELVIHTRIHTGERPFACEYCNKAFGQKHVLKNHIRTHTGEKPFVCEVCGNAFADATTLRVHIRFHTGERPYKCKYCDRKFVNSSSCNNHMTKHTGEKKYVCHLCGKAFATSMLLNSHIRAHTGEKKYACKVCDRKFHSTRNRRRHMAVHTGKRKYYMCDICGKNISSSTNFTKHRKTHVTEKPHACEICDMRFRDKTCWRKHVQAHADRVPHVCPSCGKPFVKKSHMVRHMSTHKENKGELVEDDNTKKPFACNFCNKRYKDRQCFKKHYMLHPEAQNVIYKCVICDRKFDTLAFLQEHVALHEDMEAEEVVYITTDDTDKLYSCGICEENFDGIQKFEEHLQVHSADVDIVHSDLIGENHVAMVEQYQETAAADREAALEGGMKPVDINQEVQYVEHVPVENFDHVGGVEYVEHEKDVEYTEIVAGAVNVDSLGGVGNTNGQGEVEHIEQVVLEDGQTVQTIVYVTVGEEDYKTAE